MDLSDDHFNCGALYDVAHIIPAVHAMFHIFLCLATPLTACFLCVSGVVAFGHIPAQLSGPLRARLYDGVLHLLRPEGETRLWICGQTDMEAAETSQGI